MKKKLLSVLLSLAMLLSLLPASALAVDLTDDQKDALEAQGYTEEQIAELEADDKVMVISEDTVLTEDYDGLILIVGKCTVTIQGVKIGVGVVVLPGAAETKVIVAEAAEVNAVVLLEEKAEVVVEAEAVVTYVTAAAPETVVTVEGEVERLTVNEAAEAAVVTVAETATVAAVTVAAPEAKTEIAGTVAEVTVEETAAGAETNVSGTVETMNVDAPDTTTTWPRAAA